MKVEFENDKENQGGWTWHYGKLIKDDKEYPFSLLEMRTNVGGMNVPPNFEITWVENEPNNKEEAEKLILEKF